MTTTTTHLSDAQAALAALDGVTVKLRKQKYPASATKVILLDRIVSTPIGNYEAAGTNIVVQVSSYAPTLEDALALSELARPALEAAGFHWQSERDAPSDESDPLTGVIADYTR